MSTAETHMDLYRITQGRVCSGAVTGSHNHDRDHQEVK
jgi:hypothetical protein